MKSTAGQIIAPIIIGLVALAGWALFPRVCDVPIRYHVGEIDSRFDISTSTVKELLRDAEAVWEKGSDKQLFVYSESRGLPINFVFDDRQQRTNQVNDYETTLDNIKGTRENILDTYENASAEYESEKADYEAAVDRYERELAAYNERVRTWNDRGGAPADVHEELTQTRQELGDMQENLADRRAGLESSRQQLNQLADQGNSLASQYNETAATFSERFGDSQEFNQATYVGDAINVYQFEESDDLRLALTHEFGHALGVEHVENPRSVMYYLMGEQSLSPPTLTAEDKVSFSNVCGMNVIN